MRPVRENRAARRPKSSADSRATNQIVPPPGTGWPLPANWTGNRWARSNLPVADSRTRRIALRFSTPLVAKLLVAGEVAQAVGDEVAAVELHAAQHVRAAGDHQAGPGVDGHLRERLRVAPVLAEVDLLLAGDVVGVRALGRRRACRRRRSGPSWRPSVISSRAAGTSVSLADQSYGANATNATLIRCARTTVISPGSPVCAMPAGVDRPHGLLLPGRAEVERVVVGVVQHGEAGLLVVLRPGRRVAEGEAAAAVGAAALAAGRGGERALQVAEHDLRACRSAGA